MAATHSTAPTDPTCSHCGETRMIEPLTTRDLWFCDCCGRFFRWARS
jgi:ribosomal protein L37AE/L43A